MNKSFELLVSVAKNYYVDSISKSEIAKRYSISRPTVAAILKECKEKGIVEIRINDSSPFSSPVSGQLKSLFALETACIVPGETDSALTLEKICFQAALFFPSLLRDRIRIGISWGTSLYHMIRQLSPTIVNDGEVVQLMGGLGGSALYYDGSELARILSEKLSGRCFPFLSPLLVQSEELKKSLLFQPGIRETYERTKLIDVALVGISSDEPEDSALVRAEFLSPGEAQQIFESGSCCDLCGYHFDSQGRYMDIPANRRMVGIEYEDYLRIPRRIGIASGKRKAGAILAAMKGALITDLFTDEMTALQILSLSGV
jgi:DNA-binding transcriptional regulator LsrR (DeoR family)